MPAWFSAVRRVYYAIEGDRTMRTVYYRVMRAQLQAGLPLSKAVENAGDVIGDNPIARAFGKDMVKAGLSGELITVRWRRSGRLPKVDAEMLVLGEQNGTLAEIFDVLTNRIDQPVGLWHMGVKPNVYQIVLALMATVFLIGFADFLEMIVGPYTQILENQTSYAISIFARTWGWILPVGLMALIVGSKVANEYTTGTLRRVVGPLVAPYEAAVAVRYLSLSKLLALQGVTFIKNIQIARAIFSGRHVDKCLAEIESSLTRGEDYGRLIGRKLLPNAIANLIRGLAPANDRKKLPGAYTVAEELMTQRLRVRYNTVSTLLRVALLGYAAGSLGMVVLGVYGTTADLTDYISRAGR